MTTIQQTPIKNEGKAVDIGLGSTYARQLGLSEIIEYDGSAVASNLTNSDESPHQSNQGEKGGKKKKKNNKKKKKKK